MKKFWNIIFRALCKPSTKPDLTSYKWALRERSIFASVLLWTIWACRVVSLYQHVKLIYRTIGTKLRIGYTENASGRPDVPPWLGEIYFLIFTALFSITHHFRITGTWLQIIAGYYLFESSLWILYYTVFRRFFERGYTIYHQLEYITTIILIIPTQAVCFSHLYAISFREALPALLGAGGDDTPFLITVFSYLLSAIVLGMIISNFPAENIKKSGKKAKMFIIGCGDVVKSRLYPAISRSDLAVDTALYDLKSAAVESRLPICNYLAKPEDIITEVDRNLSNNSIIWIETPPDSHLFYMERGLKTKARLLVVEKPIITERGELAQLSKLLSEPKNRSRLFFLSYYVLEKALPLSYLAALAKGEKARTNAYAKYLQIEGAQLVNNWHTLLGTLKTVEVQICEGADTRAWVTDHKTGGHLFETFLHNVLIAATFCGPVSAWNVKTFSDADYTKPVHEISMEATSGDVKISLSMKKNYHIQQRSATLVFDNGTITANFETKTAEICFAQLKTTSTIQVASDYSNNYGVMTDLVGRVHSGEYTSEEVDGLNNQQQVLEWLWQIKKEQAACTEELPI